MGKVIILEGPDGCGKTTLARKLNSHGWIYKHEGPPPDGVDIIDHYLRLIYDSLEANENVVHDRLHLGERIYGKIARGKDRLGSEGLKLFERLHQSKSITQLICLTDFPTSKENYQIKMKEKDDYLKSYENWVKVYESYKSYIGSVIHKEKSWIQFDYRHDNVSDVLDLAKIHSLKVLPKGAVGSLTARYLFIGDRPNHSYVDIPFFATTGSSGYLNQALELAHLEEDDIALYNTNECSGKEHVSLSELIGRLTKLERIFVMGSEAKNFIQHKVGSSLPNIKFNYLQHPSYLKRFRGNNPVIMAEIIRSCIDGPID